MGIEYLDNNNWIDLTREERLFCAELYYEIKGKEKEFVRWLNTKTDLNLDEFAEWEVGYEVCFYRDYYFRFGLTRNKQYSKKRTFDLCLFSKKEIILIEAKAQQGFKNKQLEEIDNDRIKIKEITGIECKVIGLVSSKYKENSIKYRGGIIFKRFDKIITWKDIYSCYNDKIFLRADDVYNSKPIRNENEVK